MHSTDHFFEIFAHFPRIELQKIRLREIRDGDAENYYNYINHPEVKAFVPIDCVPNSIENSLKDIQYYRANFYNYAGISWAIAHKKTDIMIGTVSLTNMKFIQRKSHISYDLAFEYWGKGIAKEAVKAVIDFADNQLLLRRIQANIAVTNQRSQNFTKSLGFEYEGTMKKYEILNDEVIDFDIYSRIIEI